MVSTIQDRFNISPEEGVKAPVRMTTTANITLSGLQTIDGVSGAEDDRILVRLQTVTSENGIYVMKPTAWVRASDWDDATDVEPGVLVIPSEGTKQTTVYMAKFTSPYAVDTTAVTFFAILDVFQTIQQNGAICDGVTNDGAAILSALLEGVIKYVPDGDCLIDPDADFARGAGLVGTGNRFACELTWVGTGVSTDYGLRMEKDNLIESVTINADVNAATVPNSRTNGVIYAGPDGSSGDTLYENNVVRNVVINRGGTAADITNAMQFFCNVKNSLVENVQVNGEFSNGLQYHWNFAVSGLETHHPRNITNRNIIMNDTSGFNESLSFSWRGCHDVYGEQLHSINGNQAFTISAGDVGGLTGPAAASVDRLLSNIQLVNTSCRNCKNEGIFIIPVSGAKDPGVDNERWMGVDQPYMNVRIDNHTNVKGAASVNNTTLYVTGARNVSATNIITALENGAQALDTTPAVVFDTSINCDVQTKSNCVVAVDVLSGRNIDIDIDHENSDTANTLSATGINIRGSVESVTIDGAISINDISITIDTITSNIHKGTRFEHGGNEFVFAQSAFLGATADNNNIILAIEPAVAAIADGQTIEIMHGADYVRIKGRIKDANKAVRVLGNDPRLNRGIEIDMIFDNAISRRLEVLHGGIAVKLNGNWHFNNSAGGGTYGVIGDGQITPGSTGMTYVETGDQQRIGRGHQAPVVLTWTKGDIIYDRDVPTAGWSCTVAGTPGTWVAF